METQVSTTDSIAMKAFSAALFAKTQTEPSFMKNMTGPAPQQSDAERKLKGQTSADMPIVRVTDLAHQPGDKVSIDLINIALGKPIMGDRNAEGRGEAMSFSAMEVIIDLYTKVYNAGGKMSQQRTKHQLRKLALAMATGYMPRLESQLCYVHLAGARGWETGKEWVVPISTDADFGEIVVNAVKAPTFNRHYVIDAATFVQGGQQLGSVDSADTWKLAHLDKLRVMLDDMDTKLQPIKIADDPAANDEAMAVLMLPARSYNALLTDTTSTGNIRAFQQNAWNRASYGSKHPLFRGEVGMWNGILVKKMDRSIRFGASQNAKVITAANRYTATETDQAVAAGLSTTHVVERGLLLGAQALANVYGKNQSSDYHYGWLENWYNFKRSLEVAVEAMFGKAKIRFNIPDGSGVLEPTDNGVFAIDSVVAL